MTLFTTKIEKSRHDLLQLVTGIENDSPCWYYLLVDKDKFPFFKKDIKGAKIELRKYGKILYSGWGEKPPADIEQKVMAEFA